MSIPILNPGLTKNSFRSQINEAIKSANRVVEEKFHGKPNPKKLNDTRMYQTFDSLRYMIR